MAKGRRITSLVGLLMVAAATFLPLGRLGMTLSGLRRPWGGEVLWWGLAALVLLYVVAVERQKLASIGFRKQRTWDITIGLAGGMVIFFGMGMIFALLLPALHLKANATTFATLTGMPLLAKLAMVTRAAVVEEIVFRGYAIERLKGLTGSTALAAVVSIAAFTYAHLASWGAVHLISVGFAAIVLTGLYLWRRSLVTVMIAHWLTDGTALLLLPLIKH